ncbi:flagellar basal body-associated FliL family protein [Desulfovibrio sp.]|uniref:flagellar basal body-associated FliL family protein n=1 Tax=Desulfovibrio sp. TaxID=885 RepID=UPI0025C311BD|nr:flagellar basal body-associated FliL family protein [Desulfovibrio sp.]
MAAKEKDAPALPEGQAENPKKKSRLKRIVIILAILLMTLSGAGLGGYWWLYLRTPANGAAVSSPEATGGDRPAERGAASGARQDGHAAGLPGGQPASGTDVRIERQSDLPRSGGMVLPLPPVTVNLADPSGRRYLKMGMEVEVNADVSAALQANNARIRDAIIMLLAGKSYADIASPDGKVLLKAEVAARLNQILGAQRVVRVFFTDFVVE